MNPRAVTSNSLNYCVKTMRDFLKLPSPIEIYLTCKTFRTFDFRTVCLPIRTVLANLRPQNMSKTEAKCENDKRSIKLEKQGLYRRNNNFEIKIVHRLSSFFMNETHNFLAIYEINDTWTKPNPNSNHIVYIGFDGIMASPKNEGLLSFIPRDTFLYDIKIARSCFQEP